MVLKVMTANRAVSEAVSLARPQVIPVYPITPQNNHIRIFGSIYS